jgi:hypothetical protein
LSTFAPPEMITIRKHIAFLSQSHPRMVILFGLSILLVVILSGAYTIDQAIGQAALRRAIQHADAADPHWRLSDIESERADKIASDNSALLIMRIDAALPHDWPNQKTPPAGHPEDDPEGLLRLGLQHRLSQGQAANLRAILGSAQEALTSCDELVHDGLGRFPMKWSPPYLLNASCAVCAERVVRLLELNTLWLIHLRKGDDAIHSCREILVASRAIGDEPLAMS